MPPAIIAAVVAVGASAAAAASIISVTTALVIGVLATVAGALLTKKPSIPGYDAFKTNQERKQVLRSPDAPMTICYGEIISSGLLTFAEESAGADDENEILTLVIVIAGHPIDRIGEIYIGDETIGAYGGLVTHQFFNDPQEAPQVLLDNCPSWKPDMIGRGLAYVVFRFKFDQEKFPSGLPNVKMRKFGKKVYDPRDEKTKYSNNAALVILDYLRSFMNISDDRINWEEFIVAASIADELVKKADGSDEIRYSINGEFEIDEPCSKVLEGMLEACSGELTFIGGKHGLLVGAYYGPVDTSDDNYVINPSDIISSVNIIPEATYKDLCNVVTGTFTDKEQMFTETDYPVVKFDEWIQEDGRELPRNQNYRFVTSSDQAQRLARILLKRTKVGRTVELTVNLKGYRMKPGRYVLLNLPHLGIENQEFRITAWDLDLKNGVKLTLREDFADVWEDAVGSLMVKPPLTNLPLGGVPAPDNLTYSVETIGDIVQGLLTWTNIGQIAHNNVVIKQNGQVIYTIQSPGQQARITGLEMGSYTAEVRAVSVMGAISPPSAIAFTISAPMLPSEVNIETTLFGVSLFPVVQINQSSTLFEFWFSGVPLSIDEVLEKAILVTTASNLVYDGLQSDTVYYFWIRAVNPFGRSGLMPLEAKTTADPAEIMRVIAGQVGAEHLKEELKELIILASEAGEVVGNIRDEMNLLEQRVDNSITELEGLITDSDTRVIIQKLLALDARIRQTDLAQIDTSLGNAEELVRTRERFASITSNLITIVDEQGAIAQSVLALESGVKNLDTGITERLATINQELETVSSDLETTAKSIETLSVVVNGQSAAIQQIAEVSADNAENFRAMWGVKAQINDIVGGFGLLAEKDKDGIERIKFVVDADVFEVVGRQVENPVSPFIIKNGVVYMNSAFIDKAEINTLVANYLKVTTLDALTITGSTITGSRILGTEIMSTQNPPTFSLSKDGKLTARNADISGNFNATSGTFDNILILGNSTFLGEVSADNITGGLGGSAAGWSAKSPKDFANWSSLVFNFEICEIDITKKPKDLVLQGSHVAWYEVQEANYEGPEVGTIYYLFNAPIPHTLEFFFGSTKVASYTADNKAPIRLKTPTGSGKVKLTARLTVANMRNAKNATGKFGYEFNYDIYLTNGNSGIKLLL